MVKCLNIEKNISKQIYRSISTVELIMCKCLCNLADTPRWPSIVLPLQVEEVANLLWFGVKSGSELGLQQLIDKIDYIDFEKSSTIILINHVTSHVLVLQDCGTRAPKAITKHPFFF